MYLIHGTYYTNTDLKYRLELLSNNYRFLFKTGPVQETSVPIILLVTSIKKIKKVPTYNLHRKASKFAFKKFVRILQGLESFCFGISLECLAYQVSLYLS